VLWHSRTHHNSSPFGCASTILMLQTVRAVCQPQGEALLCSKAVCAETSWAHICIRMATGYAVFKSVITKSVTCVLLSMCACVLCMQCASLHEPVGAQCGNTGGHRTHSGPQLPDGGTGGVLLMGWLRADGLPGPPRADFSVCTFPYSRHVRQVCNGVCPAAVMALQSQPSRKFVG